MKRVFNVLLFCLVAAPLAVPVLAQAPTTPAQVAEAGAKVAFLNFALVLESTEESKLEISKVRSFIDTRNKEYETRANELKTLQEQFTAQQASLNASTAAEMQREIQNKDRELRRLGEDVQAEIQTQRDGLFSQLTAKMQPVIAEYAQQNRLAAIFFLDQMQGWFNPTMDISQEIIRRYNERYPVAPSSP